MKSLFVFFILVALIPLSLAADITPDDTPCDSYTPLYTDNSLSLTEFCLIRTCLSEGKTASFYLKYSPDHKEVVKVGLTNYGNGTLKWSTGVTINISFNEKKMVDVDQNGYYDQNVWYEIDKPDIRQMCVKIYELKEGPEYKVPSVAVVTTTQEMTENVVNVSNTTNSNTNSTNGANESQNNTIVKVTQTQTNIPQDQPTPELISENTGEGTNNMNKSNKEQIVKVKSTTEIVSSEVQNGNENSKNTNSVSTAIIGFTIIVVIVAIILGIYFYIQRRKKEKFSIKLNEEIGSIDLEKKF